MCSYIGGAFGEALTPWPELVAVLLVLKSQRPVRLSFNREECFLNISHKPGEVVYVKDGVKKDGTLVARDVTTLLDVGAYSDFGAIFGEIWSARSRGPVQNTQFPDALLRGLYEPSENR